MAYLGHLRANTNIKNDTLHSLSHSFLQGVCEKGHYDGQMMSGLKLPGICLTREKDPEKLHTENLSRPGIESGPTA